MNRIYQGRVNRVQKLKAGVKIAKSPDDWGNFSDNPEDALWKNHDLFQDAVKVNG